jgi:Rho family protein
MAEIYENCPGVKLVLTALKCDLRKDEDMNDNPNAVSFDEGLAKAKEIGAVKYLGTPFLPIIGCHTGQLTRTI